MRWEYKQVLALRSNVYEESIKQTEGQTVQKDVTTMEVIDSPSLDDVDIVKDEALIQRIEKDRQKSFIQDRVDELHDQLAIWSNRGTLFSDNFDPKKFSGSLRKLINVGVKDVAVEYANKVIKAYETDFGEDCLYYSLFSKIEYLTGQNPLCTIMTLNMIKEKAQVSFGEVRLKCSDVEKYMLYLFEHRAKLSAEELQIVWAIYDLLIQDGYDKNDKAYPLSTNSIIKMCCKSGMSLNDIFDKLVTTSRYKSDQVSVMDVFLSESQKIIEERRKALESTVTSSSNHSVQSTETTDLFDKYEYLDLLEETTPSEMEVLHQHGKEGWECFYVREDSRASYVHLYFKRPQTTSLDAVQLKPSVQALFTK